MIYLKKENIHHYKGLMKNLDTALTYLETQDLSELLLGRNEVDGENVFINYMNYTTIPEVEGFFEAHLDYLDLHIMIEGEECVAVSHISTLEEFTRDEESDFVGYKGESQSKVLVNSEMALIVYPEDAHMVKIMCKEPGNVKKVVMKIRVSK